MPSQVEHDVNSRITAAFIEQDPVDLVLRRKQWVSDGAGGRKPATPSEVSLDPQRVHLEVQKRAAIRIIDGVEVRVDLHVVGMPDLDVALFDSFDRNGYEYEVINIQDEPYWRKIGEAVRRG
jgi:hypothetical protein